MVTYSAVFEPAEEGGFVITFPDFGWGISQGNNEAEAREMAADLLETILGEEIDKWRELPAATRHRGRKYREISLSALAAAKVDLYREFRRSGISKSELARRTGINKVNVDRLFSLRHASRFNQIESAFLALGKRVVLIIEDAA